MHHLSQLIDNDKNGVIAVAFSVREQWQSGHKVPGKVFPPMSWYRQGLQVTIELMSDRLWSWTNVTSSNIAFDVFFQAQPLVFPANQLSCLINFEMAYKRIIVVTTYHLRADGLRDIWEFSVLEHSFNVLSALWKIRSASEKLCFLVVFLQLRELQPHVSDVGNVRTVLSYVSLDIVSQLSELG